MNNTNNVDDYIRHVEYCFQIAHMLRIRNQFFDKINRRISYITVAAK